MAKEKKDIRLRSASKSLETAKNAIKKSLVKMIDRETTIEGGISDAFSTLEELGQEMRDAFDNTPESLQNDGVGAARGEAADSLENLSEPNVPEELQGDDEKLKVKWQERAKSPSAMRRQSRSDRRSDACEELNHIVSRLDEIADGEGDDFTEEAREAAKELSSEVQSLIDEAEAVDFPDMYG